VRITGRFPESKAKHHLRITLGKMLQPSGRTEHEELLPYLRAANVQWGSVDFADTKSMWFSSHDKAKYGLSTGDLVVLEGGDVGRSAILSGIDGFLGFQNSLHRARPLKGNDIRFALYWMQHLKSFGYFDLVCSKATLSHFTAEKFAETPYPQVDLDTQKAIADFLDRETARIDQLIEKKQLLVRLLRERSLSAIEKAVTADANFSKLGHHVKILPGYAFASASFSTNDEDIRLLRGANVSPGRIKWDDVVYWPREEAAGLDRFQLSVGDIVMGMDRPWVSGGIRVAEITERDLPALLLQRVCKVIPLKTLSKEFLKLLLSSKKFLGYFEPELTGVSVPHISGDQIAGFKFPYLPVAQQLERVRTCRTVLTSNDAIIERAQKSISRLQEYRAALITAAVTGQIDVRAASHQDATNVSLDGGKTELSAGPVSRNADPSQVRRLVAAEIIYDHRNVAYLGRIKVHKIMFLAEAHATINEINGRYVRQAAGPYDGAMINDVEAGLRQDRFYDAAEDPSSQRGRITFTPLDNAGGHKPILEAMLGDRVAELRRIIGLVQDFSTENTEAITTLYAVWNDALIDGEQPGDERIIRGFREEWHEAKQRFTAESLRNWLDWMRRNDLVPRGSGPHTISAHQPSLF